MTKTILILAIAVAFVAGTLTTATIVTAEGDTIQACIDKKGKVRIVDSPADCKNKETPIEWNIQGPKGDTGADGAKGDTGADGAKGDTGDTGADGAKGDTGDTGADGAPGVPCADCVTSTEIAANAVGSSEIRFGAVGSSEIATDAVGLGEIKSNAVGFDEIRPDAVGSSEIQANAVGGSEIAGISKLIFGTCIASFTNLAPGTSATKDCTQFQAAIADEVLAQNVGSSSCTILVTAKVQFVDTVRFIFQNTCSSTVTSTHGINYIVYS